MNDKVYLIEYKIKYDELSSEYYTTTLDEAYSNPFDAEKRKEELVKQMTSKTKFPLDYCTEEEAVDLYVKSFGNIKDVLDKFLKEYEE